MYDLMNLRYRVTTAAGETEHARLHDAINQIRREDPIAYQLEAWDPETHAPGARPFTLVSQQHSRWRS